MIFERYGAKPIQNPSPKQVRRGLSLIQGGYASLTDVNGSYVQVAGWQVQCCVEWRDMQARKHYRAFQVPPVVLWKEPTQLTTASCGLILLDPTECFRMAQAIHAFIAFLNQERFPEYIQWRDVTAELQQSGILTPNPP